MVDDRDDDKRLVLGLWLTPLLSIQLQTFNENNVTQ